MRKSIQMPFGSRQRLLMHLLVAVSFLLPILSTSLNFAYAEESSEAEERASTDLLSYAELMQLPLEQRRLYIEGVREILIDLSRKPDGRFSDSDPANRSRLKAWLDWFESGVPSAWAEDGGHVNYCRDNADCRAAMDSCLEQKQRVKWNGSGYECDSTGKPLKVMGKFNFTKSVYKRIQRDPKFHANTVNEDELKTSGPRLPATDDVRVAAPASARSRLVIAATDASSIGEYINRIVSSTNRYKCISKHQSASASGGGDLKPCSEAVERKIESDFAQAAANLKAASEKTSEALVPPNSSAETPVDNAKIMSEVSPVTTVELPKPVAATDVSTDVVRPADVEVQNEKSDVQQVKPSSAPTVPGPTIKLTGSNLEPSLDSKTIPKPAVRKPETKTHAKAQAEAVDLSRFSCAPKPEVCEDTKISRKKIFQGNLSCVFAGMVSNLDSQNRKCQAVTEFKVGESGYKCATGQTMCNPLLFGTVSATKAICVGRGHDATLQCSKLSTVQDAEKFLNRNESGLQNRWDEFRTDLEKVCKTGSVQAKFHCRECNIIHARIFELHAKILSDPCRTGTSSSEAIGLRIRARSRSIRK